MSDKVLLPCNALLAFGNAPLSSFDALLNVVWSMHSKQLKDDNSQ
jgi:hypothetical protein